MNRPVVLGWLVAALFVCCMFVSPLCRPTIADTGSAEKMFESFASVDRDTCLFSNTAGLFAVTCVTYVQPEPGRCTANAGPIDLISFDYTKLRSDFRTMRNNGIRGIYLRLGAGFFLNTDASWRRIDDPLTGVENPNELRVDFDGRLEQAKNNNIGPFTYNYEIFDYLLDTARAEGIYVIPMIMDMWSRPRIHEESIAFIRDHTWRQSVEYWKKIVRRYKDCNAILGYLVEGENLSLPTWNDYRMLFMGPDNPGPRMFYAPVENRDPELTEEFREFLRKRHVSINTLKQRWSWGYDRLNPGFSSIDVHIYSHKYGVFAELRSFDDVELPWVERPRGQDAQGMLGWFPYWGNVPMDPVWVEFSYFKESLYTQRLNYLFDELRTVDSNHMYMVNAAWDGVWGPWHSFMNTWNPGAVRCEVMLHGNGYADVARVVESGIYGSVDGEELWQSVAPYRPFAVAGAGSVGVYGMGEGGLCFEHNDTAAGISRLDETLQEQWIAGIMMDNLGSGSAFANIWDWGTLTGASSENPEPHEHTALSAVRSISETLNTDTFTRARNVKVLILANGPTLHSIIKPASYNNCCVLANALATAHVPFDIVTTDEISLGKVKGKVDISCYDVVFMPQQFQITTSQISDSGPLRSDCDPWIMIREWLDAKPNRVFCVGLIGMRDAWFNPISNLPKSVKNIVGDVRPGPMEIRNTPRTWSIIDGRSLDVVLDKTPVQHISLSIDDSPHAAKIWLTDGDEIIGISRALANGSHVYYCGFPLGLSWWTSSQAWVNISGGSINEKTDIVKLGSFYGKLIEQAGVRPEYTAPPCISAYISDNARVVLIRKREVGELPGGWTLSSERLLGRTYAGAECVGNGVIRCDLGSAKYKVLKETAKIETYPTGAEK